MAITRKPRCFIAMAFDHDDTDALFDNVMLPVLRANEIVPVIINRREDNRDINHQIMEQLDACDFCITDLTYTRPSVYFEAGYAQRAVEVIYTVRADHLTKNQPDDLRVHFDLQMKPLIKWSTPSDATFRNRLERRLKSTVLRKWNIEQKQKASKEKERARFTHMALTDRLLALKKEALTAIRRRGFVAWRQIVGPYAYHAISFQTALQQPLRFSWLMAERREKRLLHVIVFRLDESLTRTTLQEDTWYTLVKSDYPPHLDGREMIEERSPIEETIEHHLLCSLKCVPQPRIMSAMPFLHWDAENARYFRNLAWSYEGPRRTKEGIVNTKLSASRRIYFHLLDDIQSLPEFRNNVTKIVENIDVKNSPEELA